MKPTRSCWVLWVGGCLPAPGPAVTAVCAERLFNTARNNLISDYWCRTLGESLQKARMGCSTRAACQFCHLIIRPFSATALDRERGEKKTTLG